MTIPWTRIESNSYWFLFLGSFMAVAIWESLRPKGNLSSPPERRWSRHGVLLIVATIVSTGLYRASPVIVAVAAANRKFGLLNKAWLPFSIRFIVALLLLDLVKYIVHW